MCGVVGVISRGAPAITDARNMLGDSQHRGWDAAGILVAGDRGLEGLVKERGTVNAVLPVPSEDKRLPLPAGIPEPSWMNGLTGEIALAHVRYATDHSDGNRNAQPLYRDGNGLVYNGHVRNTDQLWSALGRQGIARQLETDTEALLQVFAWNYQNQRGSGVDPIAAAFAAAGNTMDSVMGAFSTLVSIQGVGLLGFRSPNGVRPLDYGRKQDGAHRAVAFASESWPLKNNGYGEIQHVKPGTAVLVDAQLEIRSRELRPAAMRYCGLELVYYADPRSIVGSAESRLSANGLLLEEVRRELGRRHARAYPYLDRIDVVVGVPRSGVAFARGFAEAAGKPYAEDGIRKNGEGRIFLTSGQGNRVRLAGSTFSCDRESVDGKGVLIGEDSIIRGVNSVPVVQLVRAAGAREVYFASSFPPVIDVCEWGVEISDRNILAAHGRTMEQIAQKIGADAVTYNTPEDLAATVGMPLDELCLACVGKSPPSPARAPEPVLIPIAAIAR